MLNRINEILAEKEFLIVLCSIIIISVPLSWLIAKSAELKKSMKDQSENPKFLKGIIVLVTIQVSIFACAAIYYAAKITFWR